MAIIRWTPFRELASMQERMNKMFDEAFRTSYGSDEGLTSAGWVPAVDIYETEKDIVLKAEIPEMEEKDIDIHVEDNNITIRGERSLEKDIKEENYHRIERSYGAFSRSFTLPHIVDRTNIKAGYKDGVLKITLPKKEETKPKKIKIDLG